MCINGALLFFMQNEVKTSISLSFAFSLQPVKETREKQVQVWKQLLLDYCRSQKIFVIGLEEDFPLFSNPVIES